MRTWSEFTKRERIMIILLGVIAVSFLFYFLLYKPKVDAVTNINNNLNQTLSSIKNNQDVLKRKEELKREYSSKLSKLKEADQDQPITIGQKSDLIVILNQLIEKTDVNLKTMESAKNKEIASDKYGYTKMPIEIEISGAYNNILNFVNQIERLKYLIKINTLNLKSNLRSGLESESTIDINAQIKLVAFATNDG